MTDGPGFSHVLDPTADEIRAWAYSGAAEPMQDWDVLIAEPAHIGTLLALVADEECPARRYLLGSLYCLVGHTDRSDPALTDAARTAALSPSPWVRTWGTRVLDVLTRPSDFRRADWCGSPGLAGRPEG